MIQVSKIYIQHVDGQARLCAAISLNGRGTTLWFGVEESQAGYLCAGRGDPFIMALLPAAMRAGQDIHCETPMSERLHYQLEQYLIPSLCAAGTLYRPIRIHAPLTAEPVPNQHGVAFSAEARRKARILRAAKQVARQRFAQNTEDP